MFRAKTNPSAKQLHTVLVRGTGVDVTGCIILLQFCPRLTKGGGHLEHDNIGEAIYILNKKLKVTSIMLKGKNEYIYIFFLKSYLNLFFLFQN